MPDVYLRSIEPLIAIILDRVCGSNPQLPPAPPLSLLGRLWQRRRPLSFCVAPLTSVFGSFGAHSKTRGLRDGTPSVYLRFSFFDFPLLNSDYKARDMRRVELTEATMRGWARLDAAQRQRFFEAFVSAAVRLDRLELRAWLRRRLKNPPLAPPIDLARFAISDADIATLLNKLPLRADDADGGTGL
jgi:hypothetical protein